MGNNRVEKGISYGELKSLTEEKKNKLIEGDSLARYAVEELGGEIAGTREIISETQPEESSSEES